MDRIKIQGAKTHNLKNITVEIPKNKFVVVTGRSGSGKSSLAFDTLYAEGQRRYVESLSTYARQFLSPMGKPPVDSIEGLCPAIAIDQKGISHNPRSTVGTMTELYDYFRVLFARVGIPYCPVHTKPLQKQSLEQIVATIFQKPEQLPIAILANLGSESELTFSDRIAQFKKLGYRRARVNGEWLEYLPIFNGWDEVQSYQLVIDRIFLSARMRNRLIDSLELALGISNGSVTIMPLPSLAEGQVEEGHGHAHKNPATEEWELTFSLSPRCLVCEFEAPILTPQQFSFNHAAGACPACQGLGSKSTIDPQKILLYPDRSLRNGAIAGCNPNHAALFAQLETLAAQFDFSLDQPYSSLSAQNQERCLYGDSNEQGEKQFKGIIAHLENKYQTSRYPAFKERLAELLTVQLCRECEGSRLHPFSRQVRIHQKTLPELLQLNIADLFHWFESLAPNLTASEQTIAAPLLHEILARLKFLLEVGLDYLTLARNADTLSGGESQRIRLASQIGSGLTGVLYVLDEPSIGLHAQDNQKLLNSLQKLKNLGNTLLVVEHDEETMRFCDHIIEIGPAAGQKGGYVVASGTPQEIELNPNSETGAFLSRRKSITHPSTIKHFSNQDPSLELIGAKGNNLKGVNIKIPQKSFCCVTGVSGSGKSTLIGKTLYPTLAEKLNRCKATQSHDYDALLGLELFDKVITIDQNPLGRTPRSNAVTYTGVFNEVRDLFSALPEARARGYRPGRFSFNVPGGRCENCEGDGVIKVSMHFLPDMQVECEQCEGRRYNRATREIHFNGKSIDEVLELSVDGALAFFEKFPSIVNKLSALQAVGLGYLPLGQPATTLSGGEAQRVKLSKELAKRATGNTLYILDEPTTGLHFADIQKLLNALILLRDQGNTLLVIEHHLDLIRLSDWIIDLGPYGGNRGGEVIAMGSVAEVRANERSLTGLSLRQLGRD